MRILFQTIGVLVQYNWALPYYLSTLREGIKVDNLTNLFSYLMGGYYYHLRSLGKITPIFEEAGIKKAKTLDKIFRIIPIKKLVMKKNYDIVHLNRYDEELLAGNFPKIFTFHGSLDIDHVKNIPQICRKLNEVYSKVEAFIAPSFHSARTIEDLCGFKPKVIHNGVDTDIFNPFNVCSKKARAKLSLPKNKKLILWIGRLDPDKGLHILIKALPLIVKERNDILVVVKGRAINKRYFEWINALTEILGVRKYIIYRTGWTPNIKMIYYYRATDVYVHTSFSEGFSLTLLEAMASGVPVVGNNASSIPEALGNAGLLFNGTEEELAQKVLEVLTDEKKASKMGLNEFQRVIEEGFTAMSMAKKYLEVYSNVTK